MDDAHKSPINLVRNDEFYIDIIVFRVENELYKVLRKPFVTHSQVFRDMLTIPQPGAESTEGLIDSNPIFLQGVKKLHFQVILRLFNEQTPIPYVLSLHDWIAVLEHSRTWLMKPVHSVAHSTILHHKDLDNQFVERINLARKYDLSALFVLACRDVIKREEVSLTYSEALAFGIEGSYPLIRLRDERFLRRRSWEAKQVQDYIDNNRRRYYDSIPESKYNDDEIIDRQVREVFKEEITRMERAHTDLFQVA